MPKLCTACQEEPRMVSQTGKELTMCQGCQRDYWSNKQAERLAKQTRFCKQCRTNQPVKHFARASRVCQTCKGAPLPVLKADSTRTCAGCHAVLPLADFRHQGRHYQALCKPCYIARQAEQQRRKETGEAALPRVQFRGSAPLLDTVVPHTTATHAPLPAGVLLVDRERGQVILCTVQSEIPMDAKRMDSLIDFYAARGHRIVDAVERVIEMVVS